MLMGVALSHNSYKSDAGAFAEKKTQYGIKVLTDELSQKVSIQLFPLICVTFKHLRRTCSKLLEKIEVSRRILYFEKFSVFLKWRPALGP